MNIHSHLVSLHICEALPEGEVVEDEVAVDENVGAIVEEEDVPAMEVGVGVVEMVVDGVEEMAAAGAVGTVGAGAVEMVEVDGGATAVEEVDLVIAVVVGIVVAAAVVDSVVGFVAVAGSDPKNRAGHHTLCPQAAAVHMGTQAEGTIQKLMND